MVETQLHLRWHSHSATFTDMLQDLHLGRAYTDVSLICDGGVVRAHRAVLSLCSPYLATVLAACPNAEDPLLLPETPVQDVRYLISFIYRGQVDVHQQHISSFINTAKHLHVLGLDQGDKLVDSPCKSDESSVSSGSDIGDESQLLNGNNNNIEKGQELLDEEEEKVRNLLKPDVTQIKQEMDEKPGEGECAVTTDGRIDLNYYLQQAIQSASMPCPLCKKEFKSQSGLRDHIRLHTGERPFECEFCQMNFARASHLKRHRRMHTGEKPFECRICGKDFSRGDKLKDHIRRHEAEDKLAKIRNQIYSSEDGAAADLNSMVQFSNTSVSPSSTFRSVNSVCFGSPVVTMQASNPVLTVKSTNVSSDTSMMPPVKRRRGRPPKNQTVSAVPRYHHHHHQQRMISDLPPAVLATQPPLPQGVNVADGIIQAPNSVPETNGLPSDPPLMPPMLGVTSIGECILRPIN